MTRLLVPAVPVQDGYDVTFRRALEVLPDAALAPIPAAVEEYLLLISTVEDHDTLAPEPRLWSQSPVALASLGLVAREVLRDRGARPAGDAIPALQFLAAATAREGTPAAIPKWWNDPRYITAVHRSIEEIDPEWESPTDLPEPLLPFPSIRQPSLSRVEPYEGQYACECTSTRWRRALDSDPAWYVCVRCGLTSYPWAVAAVPEMEHRFEGGPVDGDTVTTDELFHAGRKAGQLRRESLAGYRLAGAEDSEDLFSDEVTMVWRWVAAA